MIQLLATRYNKHIALALAFIFYLSVIIPVYGMAGLTKISAPNYIYATSQRNFLPVSTHYDFNSKRENGNNHLPSITRSNTKHGQPLEKKTLIAADSVKIDGPSQPEMSSFKPAGTNDMVNLFTGDFSYNIPLLDVGGYPVNIFYNGGITMEQEASWVGLGWNINPGTISRNMRGVPDDFNGEELLTQKQNMKKNITWGISMGADLELVGIKQWNQFFSGTIGASIGYSLNNYLGPAIELGIKGTTSFRVGAKGISEKGPIGVSAGLSADLNSRSGMTLTPNISLTANLFNKAQFISTGVGISTSYNSRSGIKSLQLSEQMSMNYTMSKLTSELDKNGKPIWQEYNSSIGGNITSSSISFTKPSYIPSMRASITNSSGAGRFQLGGAMFGVYPSFEVEGYGQVSTIQTADQTLTKPMVGYLYAEQAKGNRNAVMDFTRFNDQEVTPSTTIISVPQYSYDVFSIQGEGTGGTIRAYRNDDGYVRDNFTVSKDKSWSAGIDVGIPGHVGTNFNTVKTPSTIGEWNNGNGLRNSIGFSSAGNGWENVYFRNPGETSVLQSNQFDNIGGTDLVRYKLGGTNFSPAIETRLEKLTSSGTVIGDIPVQNLAGTSSRKKRTQVINFLTAEEANNIGLDKKIKIYNSDPQNFLDIDKKLSFTEVDRWSANGYRKKHHISQINVTEADGKRYVYGIPVYNLTQKDFSFTVASNCIDCDLVSFSQDETSPSASPHMSTQVGGKDGYVQTTETPAYAHSFLLSGLLSPDYVDVKDDGITEDDLGTAVKFNYTNLGTHRWRTPMPNGMANSNPGNLSETRDDKALISYGERESWYLQSVESKTMIAFFTLEDRGDGKGIGINGEFDNINYNDNSLKRLKQIDLYNKADLKKNGLAGAKPIKTVHFGYNYSLCPGTPDNSSAGKLTLEKIWFTYNGQNRANKNQYVFSYTKGSTPGAGENPSYQLNESDRWGNYKPSANNPSGMKNRDYPYAVQNKTTADQNANAWSLKKILLPSGGQMEIEYESDDYAFVQNKRAAVMSEIIGFSSTNSNPTANLYRVNGSTITENYYIFIKVSESCNSKTEVYQKYLQGMNQLLVKLMVNMPKGPEYLTSYAGIEDYDVYTGAGTPAIWIKMKPVTDKGIQYSPLSVTALEFLRERLPGQAFKAYDVSDGTALEQLENMFKGLIEGIKTTFKRIPQYLRENHKAQTVDLSKSFARLNDPDGYKYGGGYRVKKIVLKDNWDRMTNQYGSTYGQEYNYETKEVFNDAERTISSGVASYEPSIGGEENPFQSIIQISDEVPLGPTSYGAIEMPVMDAFFPAPVVGYSKVTVTSIGKQQNPDPTNKKTRSAVGRQVTEFYTAKDFPVYNSYSPLDPASDKQKHINPTLTFFYKYAFDSRAISQGFLIATNDMHGKMKSQSSYAENDPSTRINYTENFYRNTGVNGLNEKFDFVYNSLGGEIQQGNMGIDIELMTDTREFSLKSNSVEVQAQVDWMIPPLPPILPAGLWLPFVWPVVSQSENTYRAVTTTKVISYHAVLDRVVVIDKGSQVSTQNLVYDAETGQVIVNRTNNEFDKPVYSVNYPAYWAYSGMGPAYKNIDAVYSDVDFLDGKIVSNNVPVSVFESGDELYIIDPRYTGGGCDPSPMTIKMIWAFNKNKNTNSLTDVTPDFIFIDEKGKPYSRNGVKFRIVRSGKRNMLQSPVAAITLMTNPVDPATHKLSYNAGSKITNASAVEYKEKWQTDNDVIRRYTMVAVPNNAENLITNSDFSNGNTGFTSQYTYNPASGFNEGVYNVGSNVPAWHSGMANCNDHTSGNGNMLMVNGAAETNRIIWSQTVSVTPNSEYNLSAWVQHLSTANPAQLRFLINGVQVGSDFQLNSSSCFWTNYLNFWNSGSSTSATISIIDASTVAFGNDFAIDDISFILNQCTEMEEVEDCNGYLEKGLNPYCKGLLGNFRGHRNMVFYGDIAEIDPTNNTNLLKNGFLAGFTAYWNFNSDKNLIPDNGNLKWVWNVQSTRFNSRGMELETMDALQIYTGAQYGYNKTLPTAITSNSRYEGMAYDGFEDYGYDDVLNSSAYYSCAKKHIDFAELNNSQIVDAQMAGFNAHTGKYVLGVNAGSALAKLLPVKQADDLDYGLTMQAEVTKTLSEPGGNYSYDFAIPSNTLNDPANSFIFSGNYPRAEIHIVPIDDLSGGGRFHYYTARWNFYIQITEAKTYTFSMALSTAYNNNGATINTHSNAMSASIRDLQGNVVSSRTLGQSGFEYTSDNYTAFLCPGIYKVEGEMTEIYSATNNDLNFTSNNYSWACTNSTSLVYKTLTTQNGCAYTKPIPGSALMLNPTFSLAPDKKMAFSAWVREANAQQPTYTNNEVQVDFGAGNPNNVTLKPTGPVIEGWQRYEGYFIAPSGVTQMTLKLVNNTGSTIYFDDIRIHPFNANMKSYVYDPVNLRLKAELDGNNYASFYEYDDEGTLIRTKAETRQGIKTITESRSAKQKNINDFQ